MADTKERLREDIATVKAYTNAAMETDGMTCSVFVAINQVCAALRDALDAATPPADAALADAIKLACNYYRQAGRVGTTSQTLAKQHEAAADKIIAAALRARAVPEAVAKDVFSGVTHIDAGFNYSTETRLTTPSVTLFFEPGNGEKNSTWLARDAFRERLHAILSATDTKEGRSNG